MIISSKLYIDIGVIDYIRIKNRVAEGGGSEDNMRNGGGRITRFDWDRETEETRVRRDREKKRGERGRE